MNYTIEIDTSDLDRMLDTMKMQVTPEKFDRIMRRTLNEVGNRSKAPITKAILAEYEAPKNWVRGAIKRADLSGGGGSVDCKIPVISVKGNVGSTFKAYGGHPGWHPPKYRVSAEIVKGKVSMLPANMGHQGGQPPFRNTKAAKLNNLVYTRSGKERLPIERVSALAVPQMPLNRAKDETVKAVSLILEKRVEHNFAFMFGGK